MIHHNDALPILNRSLCGVNPSKIYFGYSDMHVKRFDKKKWDAKLPCSTLDHKSNFNPNRGIQNDAYNCGIWALIEICNRKCGANEPIGSKTTDELNNYRLRIFTLMITFTKLHKRIMRTIGYLNGRKTML